jgi:hypothetical protein
MQNPPLLEILAEAFQYNMHHFQCLVVLMELGQPNIENGAHDTEKHLLKT